MWRMIKDFFCHFKLTSALYKKMFTIKERRRKQNVRKNLDKNGKNVLFSSYHDVTRGGIPFFFDMGTMVGIVREGRIISHDLDIDEFVEKLSELGYKHVLRFVDSDNQVIEDSFSKLGIKFDVHYYRQEGDKMYCCICFRPPQKEFNYNEYEIVSLWCDTVTDMIDFPVYDASLPVPENYEKLLSQKYGENWRIPDKNWKYWLGPNATIVPNAIGKRVEIIDN